MPETTPTTKVVIPSRIDLYFDTGSSRLRPDSLAKLNAFATSIKSNRGVRVMVNGYTDNVGKPDANMRLSEARANMVAADLRHRGIATDVLTTKGYGQDNPEADNATGDGRAKNRHVSVAVEQ
jgi:outer membrane protein OmpA-like peptidoglycan-associated protein